MSTELNRVIEAVVREKSLQKEEVVKAIEESVISAVENVTGAEAGSGEFEVQYNEEEGAVELFRYKEVVEQVADPQRQGEVGRAKDLDPDSEVGEEIGIKVWSSEPLSHDDADGFEDSEGKPFTHEGFTRVAIQNAKHKILQ